MRDTWISDYPCKKCGGAVKVEEIDEIHGDVRWECLKCGAHGIEEGPDT